MLPKWERLKRKVEKLLGNSAKIEHIKGGHGIFFETEFLDVEKLLPLMQDVDAIHVSPRTDWKNKTWLSVSIWPKRRSEEEVF
jgi:hypothetical protein